MKKSSAWQVFKLLMWKNYLLQVRKPLSTLFEFCMPLFCCILTVYLRYQIQPIFEQETFQSSPLLAENYTVITKFGNSTETNKISKLVDRDEFKNFSEILYSPKNDILEEILSQIEEKISLLDAKITALNSSTELEAKLNSVNHLVGFEFPDNYKNLKSLPKTLNYNIRLPGEHRSINNIDIISENWNTKHLFPLFPLTSQRTYTSDDGPPVRYYDEGFLIVQNMIFESFMKASDKSSLDDIPEIFVQKFPYPKGFDEQFIPTLKMTLPMLIAFCFLYPSINIVKYIVIEKETKLKKIMRIMGVNSNLHFITWFIKSFIYLILIAFLVLTILTINLNSNDQTVLTKSSKSLLYTFIIIYSIITIIFSFMASSIFHKSSTATAVASFLWILQVTPYVANCDNFAYEEISKIKKIILSLMPNFAMSIGMRIVATSEMHDGVQWTNLFELNNEGDSFGEIMIMLIVCGVWMALVTVGIKKIRKVIKGRKFEDVDVLDGVDNVHEANSNNLFLKIQNLTKIFPNSSKLAVNKLNLSLHQDQITVLLGINGAGKSTTMSMLCGEIKPTSGTVYANDVNLLNSGRIFYKSTGIAFQENILFQNLTVHEHLILFGGLKGNSKAEAEIESQNFIKILNLNPNDYAKNLSGGMKRKLCMAIALCADSKFVILDEISSGVDPSSRREIWNFLQSVKKNRSIFMSTHYMLEAEVVADKIAILCEGRLKAFGSPFELKQKFSKTCKLTCVKQTLCDSRIVTDFIHQSIPNVKVSSENTKEICYRFECEEVPKMHNVLEKLENHMDELHLENFGISSSSMDEVMERVDDILDDRSDSEPQLIQDSITNHEEIAESVKMPQTSSTQFFQHLNALLLKRLIVTKRNFHLYLIQIGLPVLFVFLDVYFGYDTQKFVQSQPHLNLSIHTYPQSKTFIKIDNNVEINSSLYEIYESYKFMIKNLNNENIKLEVINGSMEEHFLKNSKTNLDLNYRNLYGVTVNKENITAWFNNQPFHTLPIALNLVHNAILKATFGENYGINVGNKPLPYRNETRAANLAIVRSKVTLQLFMIISFALSVSYSLFVIPVTKERITMAKSMQLTIGIHPLTYWLSFFIWDLLIVSIIASTTSIAIIETYYDHEINTRFEEFYQIFGMILICGISVLPIAYASNFLFSTPSSGFIKLVLVYAILGPTFFTIKFVFMELNRNVPLVDFLLDKMFVPVPHNNFCDSMEKLVKIDSANEFHNVQCKYFDICDEVEQCKAMDQYCDTNMFTWTSTGILWNLTRYALVIFISCYALFLVESKTAPKIFNRIKKFITSFPIKFLNRPSNRKCSIELNPNTFNTDPDVENEKRKVQNLTDDELKSYNLVLKNVSKNYKLKEVVKQICVAVKPGECFGLLGANGAGKTTTFRMLTGDLTTSSGEIYIQGLSLKTNLKQIRRMIGYCGQFDAHIEELTGREILAFYAKCRGIKNHEISHCIMKLATDFDFLDLLDKQVQFYSGGNKRKLSTAIALIGDSPIIFLDEPTSFMDPIVKKKFWNQLTKLRDSGRTIILSSHSMDEVEVLCTRIGIMMNGEMKCLGSPQYLKNKFGKTIVVTLKLKKIEINDASKCKVKRFIDKELPGAILKEEFHDMLIYHLSTNLFKWSKIFKTIEIGKEILDIIDDFSVNQSNMIQVFLQVTSRMQDLN